MSEARSAVRIHCAKQKPAKQAGHNERGAERRANWTFVSTNKKISPYKKG